MNFLDRTIATIAPQAALRRALARAQLDAVRAFDAAGSGRRTGSWIGSNASANAETRGALSRIRARSRDVVRNTWWGPRIVSVFTAHAVGTGITPVFKTGDKALNREAAELWRDWGRTCDAEGQLGIDGLVGLGCRSIIESGEVLARLIPMQRSGKRVPLEIMLLEPDHLDSSRDTITAGRIVDQGIEYGASGRRSAYWLLPEHPGHRGLISRQTSVRVPADQVLHVYRKDRIGQGRGVPWVAPVILNGRDVADLEEAIRVKARVEACLALLVKTNDTARTLAGAQTETKSDGSQRRLETLSPAMIRYLEPGEDVEVVNPSSSLAFESVLQNSWMTLAAGAGITYDQLTGDLRRANYSSLRAGKIEFRRLVEQFQWLTLVSMLLDPLADAFVEMAQTAGSLPRRSGGYPREWIMPANEPIDPLKDLQADILAVRAGRMTWPQFVAAWGFDPDEQLDEIADWMNRFDDKEVVLDSDPRRAAKGVKGASQTETKGDGEDKQPDDSEDDGAGGDEA